MAAIWRLAASAETAKAALSSLPQVFDCIARRQRRLAVGTHDTHCVANEAIELLLAPRSPTHRRHVSFDQFVAGASSMPEAGA